MLDMLTDRLAVFVSIMLYRKLFLISTQTTFVHFAVSSAIAQWIIVLFANNKISSDAWTKSAAKAPHAHSKRWRQGLPFQFKKKHYNLLMNLL